VIGQTISHYRVVAKIGAGGMGEVYRAHDPRLERDVAIKTLSGPAVHDPVRLGRFEREARATGALNHPNILAIYDIGQHEGMPYIVSELLRGGTLRQRLRAGDVSPRRALEYAIQLADGLAAAHARGIIHRDLKPENVFVTDDGIVKILDFGLAKLHQTDAPSRDMSRIDTPTVETEAGAIVGTLGYMSPEQLHGRPADHRSDIFAFGAVLYEMLAGTRAFSGDSKANVVAAILRDDPPTLASFQRPVPLQLEQLVRRCLEKRPEDRYQSAHDLAHALRDIDASADWSTGSITVARLRKPRRLATIGAVLAVAAAVTSAIVIWRHFDAGREAARGGPAVPDIKRVIFVCADAAEGEDRETAQLACGVSAWLARAMQPIEAQTDSAVWAVMDRPVGGGDLIRVSRELGATIATRISPVAGEGGGALKMDLASVPSGDWQRSTTLHREPDGECGLLRRAFAGHVRMLEIEVTDATEAAIDALVPATAAACRQFVVGLGFVVGAGGASPESPEAVLALENAVAADPEFAPAKLVLAEECRRLYRETGSEDWLERGREAAKQALELDESLADGWLEMSDLRLAGGQVEEAVADLERAVSLAPERPDVQKALGIACRRAGQIDRAEEALQRAIRLRPGDGSLHMELGYLYYVQGERDAAINHFRRSLECTPDNYLAFSNLGGIYLYFGMRDEAREMFERSLAIEPNFPAYSNLGYLAFSDSNFGDAVERYERALELEEGDYVTWGNLGLAYHHRDHEDDARRCLARAVELADGALEASPYDSSTMIDLATYNGVLGNRERALELLDRATREPTDDPVFMALVGEAYEDTGERERSLEWVERAFEAGLDPAWIDNSPTLRRVDAIRDLARRYGG
jgi:serine/threonine-protein kinase